MLEVSHQTETRTKNRGNLVRIIATNIEVTAFLRSFGSKSREYKEPAWLE